MGEPIRVLHILQRMEAGGTQALLMNIYRKIDRTKVQFDFLVVYKEKQFYDDIHGRADKSFAYLAANGSWRYAGFVDEYIPEN